MLWDADPFGQRGLSIWQGFTWLARLNNTDLRVWDFSRTNLSGAWFMSADLVGTWLIDADLSGARLPSADLSNAQCVGADLSGADLFNARLDHTGFKGASFVGADLRDTDLRLADLAEVDLTDAIIGLHPKWLPPGWRLDAETGRLRALGGTQEISRERTGGRDVGVAQVPAQHPGQEAEQLGRVAPSSE
jgi:hypothetical protein